MDCAKLGGLIRSLRREKGMTQQQLAERMNLSGKTISKWETGRGCPDVTLLAELSSLLGADLAQLLGGELTPNERSSGNMKNTRYYICPVCGSISLSTGNAQLSCCGRNLEPLQMRKALPAEQLQAEIVEDEWFISSDHPMEKNNYIPFVAFQTGEKVELVKQYPEWSLQLRIKKRGHGRLIWFDPEKGLLYRLL